MKVAAAILAGGSGRRFGGDVPKQFRLLSGKAVIEYSVDAFEKNELIDEICVVAGADYIGLAQEILRRRGCKKPAAVICGGKERYDSSLAAINFFKGRASHILIHDAARPMVSERIITEAVRSLAEYDAVCTAVCAADTIAVADPDTETIKEIPPRRLMYQVQTPQGFRLETIAAAYEAAVRDPSFAATDDCGVVRRYLPDVPIKIVEGSTENLKITYPEDLKKLPAGS